jgi:hypothetical protein
MSDFEQFQYDALKTESIVDSVKFDKDKFHAIMGLATVSAEIADMMKKNIFYGKPIKAVLVDAELERISHLVTKLKGLSSCGSTDVIDINPRVLHGVIGKFTEVGELIEAVMSAHVTDEPLDSVNVMEELGDDQWYNAILTDELGIDMGITQDTVIAKLKSRFPDKFDADKAINRDVVTERQVLENGHNANGSVS